MGKALKRALFILLIAAALTGFALGGLQHLNESYVNLGGVMYPRDLQVLDLSGQPLEDLERIPRFHRLEQLDISGTGATVEQYEWLRRHLPGCAVIWELPFQGSYYSRTTRTLKLTSLTPEEAVLLDYLPLLTSVDAWDCPDYAALTQLQQRRPECKVFYTIEIGTERYDCDTSVLNLHNASDPELAQKLACLPRLSALHFTGTLPAAAQLLALEEAFPDIDLSWQGTVGGADVDSSAENLDLRSRPGMGAAELDALLRYFPRLKTLYLGATDLPEEALLALERGREGLFIVWPLEVAGVTVSRDARELDISGQTIRDVEALEQRLTLLPRLERVIMSHCGLTSQQMDELDQRHPDIRFIWSVNLGGVELRTDAVWFCPNKYYLEVDDRDLEDLRYCYDMVCIDIGHNRGVTHCQWAASMPKLKYLIIADTNIKDLSPLAGLPELVFLEVFMSPVRDYTPLLECTALEDLNLGYTYGNPTPVTQMTWLKRLWWPGALRVLNWSVRNTLKTNLPDAKMNFVAGSSTGEGWRAGQHYYEMRDIMGMPYMTG